MNNEGQPHTAPEGSLCEQQLDSTSQTPNPLSVMCLSVLGFAVGIGITLYRFHAAAASIRFAKNPQTLAWILMMGVQTMLWFLLAASLLQSLHNLKGHAAGHTWSVTGATLLFGVFLFAPAVVPGAYEFQPPLILHREKMTVLFFIGAMVALMAVLNIWLVRHALHNTLSRFDQSGERIKAFLRLREQTQRFLSFLAMIMVGATLGSSMLRHAILADDPSKAKNFPLAFVLLYGAYFSILIVLAYVPTHVAFLVAGRQLRDALFPLPVSDAETWATWYANRKSFEDLLQLQFSTRTNVQAGIAILSPLAGSVASVLLSGVK